MPKSDPNISDADRRRYRLAAYTTGANIVAKSLSVFVLYMSVPLTITYLGTGRFGVWMTLTSLISFLGFLDFGIGSSLLNEVAHSSVKESPDRVCRLVTHGLCLLVIIGIVLGGLLYLVARQAPLQELFNARTRIGANELRDAAETLALLIGMSLPIVGLQRVFWGLQKAFIFQFLSGFGSIISLVLLFIMAHERAPIYVLLLGTYGVQLVVTIPLLFILLHKKLVGNFEIHEFIADGQRLFRYGGLFFILSIGGAVAWDSDYIIISRAVGPSAVAVYAIAVRMFQLVQLPLQMLNTPLWAAYADAFAQNARRFLRRTLARALIVTATCAIAGVLVLGRLHEVVVRIWVHKAVVLPAALIYWMEAWVVVQCVGNAFAMYLNGVRVVGAQVIVVVMFCLVAVPLKILGAESIGAIGVVAATLGSYLLCVTLPYLTVLRDSWIKHLRVVELPSIADSRNS